MSILEHPNHRSDLSSRITGRANAACRALILDRFIGDTLPRFTSAADIKSFEEKAYAERIAATSTFDAIRLGASHNPDAPAIQFLPNASHEDTPILLTHRQFLARVIQTANALYELGITPRDVVSFMLPLIPQSFFTLFGGEAAGICNPVNPLLEPHQIAEILRAAGTKVLVALGPTPGTDIWEKVLKIRNGLSGLEAILQVGGSCDEANNVYSFDAIVGRQPADRVMSGREISPDDVAAYFHTGGTTGTPKLVRHTHANQVYQAWGCNLLLKGEPGIILLFGMPLFHVGGALTQALATLSAGSCLVVLSPSGWRNPAAIRNLWPLVERFRPVALTSVPTVLAASLAVPVGTADVSSLRFIGGGGSAIPVAVGNALQEKHGVPVIEVYGMTETSSVHTLAYPDRPIRLGSVGHPLPYSRVRIVQVGADGRLERDCAVNEIGIVAMWGPGVFSGYLNEMHNKSAFVQPGWVNSGDLGRLDEDGYLWITGRAKDLVIRGGHNIDPGPIEDLLFQHPAVSLAAVVGQPDAYAGELPIAYVQLRPDATIAPGELEAWLRERTPERAAVPVAVIPMATMPLTGVGKVFKPQLRWKAAERVFAQLLEPLSHSGVRFEVSIGAHEIHGTFAKIAIAGASESHREAIAQQVQAALSPFVIRHEVSWG
ncbi:MAG: fatty-acyl-CoA synthase [Methylobacteriaceae bacterium]|nr:fatty-acyl-CoA synthase [Methylobacteriaceae bacterium]